ncbi:calcium release-activated calcium channel protein 1 [Tetranychus urticae]|uniref:Calcium release-activated calcium channel protein 1 n=1 Tax=Tetranychus urticae TaxID=32264 RepID=T1K071_TETUR|nr:calcium release-activated calcium channel protein 1 [Tetranychus urticae]
MENLDSLTANFLSDLCTKYNAKEMSRQDHVNSLSWRRLHLSRAKLKASQRTSALLSGFAMIAMVEVQLNPDSKNPIPFGLLISFAICTVLLVSMHMLALMISTCILPHLEVVCTINGIGKVSESPHEKLNHYIEIAWTCSTVLGIFLFLIEIAILCWVKFWDFGVNQGNTGHKAALAATLLLIPIFIIFIGFAVHFYRRLISHKFETSAKNLQEIESMASQLKNDPVLPMDSYNEQANFQV